VPCIFCLAVFAMLAGAITTAVLDEMESRLSTVASAPIRRTVDSASAAAFETSVRGVPVAVTVYKKYKRVRIQVLTHDISRADAEALENLIAQALGLTIVDRSDAHDEAKVREAFGVDPEELTEADAETAETRQQVRSPRSP
jgi:hypothetical protein